MSTSYTFTGTETYSVSDVKAVMQNIYEDIIGFANRQMVEYDQAKRWIEDLTYLLNNKALRFFELQLVNVSGVRFKSYRYDVNTWGIITSGDASGGINYYSIPSDTKVTLFASLDDTSSKYAAVLNELLNSRGWGTNGAPMEGTASLERSYVSNNLQLKRSVITK